MNGMPTNNVGGANVPPSVSEMLKRRQENRGRV